MSERISAWWTSRSIIATAVTSSPKISPQAENGLLRGDDQRGAFVARGDEAEHEVGGLGVERDVADLVDDEQRDERQPPQLGVEAVLALGFGEPGDPFGRGRERDALAGQAGADRDRDREVRLAGPGRAEQDDVLAGVQEVELAEVLDDLALDRALEGEVELLERLAGGEARGLDAALAAVALARGDLGREQRLGEALIAPLLLARALGELRQRARGGRRLERAEQVRELGGLALMPGSAGRSAPAAGSSTSTSRPRRRSPRSCSSAAWWAGSVKQRPPANTRAWRAASSPVSSATA